MVNIGFILRRDIMKKFLSLLLTLIICLSLSAPGVSYAATIKLNKTKLELHVGESYTLKLPGASKTIKWTSSKKSIATVTSSGKVSAVKEGKSTITATYNKKKYKCTITVKSNKTVDVIFKVYMIDGVSIEEYAENYKKENPVFLDVKVYDKEHVIVTMYEAERIKALNKLSNDYDELISSILSDDSLNGIFTDIDTDKLFQNITIYADKEKYENSPTATLIASFAFSTISDTVQAINLVNPDDRIYNISIVDNATGEVLYQVK